MIVDTDIIIDYLRNKGKAVELIEHYKAEKSVETTDINVFELYHGVYKSKNTDQNLSNLKGFLKRIRTRSTTEESMELAGKIAAELENEGEKIGAKDVLIGGIALLENKPVLSYNKRHFQKINNLKLLETDIDN